MTADNSLPRRLLDAVASKAAQCGWCRSAETFEPKSAPQSDFHFAVTMMSASPHLSGLISTTFRIELACRIYVSMLREPQSSIDPEITAAAWDLMTMYSSGFTLGGLVREVDLLGESGEPLGLKFGYIGIDKRLYRIAEIVLPVICNDVFDQGM
jgi:hypothetical protein